MSRIQCAGEEVAGREMVAAIVAACAVLLACGLIVFALNRSRQLSDRRLDIVLARIDGHLDLISTSVAHTVERVVQLHRDQLQPPPTLDFDALVDSLVAEAAERTAADAVVLHITGPAKHPIVASLGCENGLDLLERTLAPPEDQPFRAATIDWSYGPSGDADNGMFRSAVVTPLNEADGMSGTLVAYSTTPHAFAAEHASVLREVVERFATALDNARRFAEVEARILLEPSTGVVTRRGYEIELGRAVERARRTGRPLSLVFVGLETGSDTALTAGSANGEVEFARLLRRMTRTSDISCRRGDHEFAILLPGTGEAGATILAARLRTEAEQTLGGNHSTLATGHVEWHPEESVGALDARAETALAGRPRDVVRPAGPRMATVASLEGADQRTANAPLHAEPTDVLRRDVLDVLEHEVAEAHRSGRSLALVVLDVDGLAEISEQLGREAADATLSDLARQLDERVEDGSVLRLGPGEFALVLAGATADDAELLLDTLQSPDDDVDDDRRATVSAGVTEIAAGDDAAGALARAEHALWQARQAGRRGTVVVALTGKRAPRSE